MTVRTKFSLAFGALMVVTVGVAARAAVWVAERQITRELRSAAENAASEVAKRLEGAASPWGTVDEQFAQAVLTGMRQDNPDIVSAVLVYQEEERRTRTLQLLRAQPGGGFQIHTEDGVVPASRQVVTVVFQHGAERHIQTEYPMQLGRMAATLYVRTSLAAADNLTHPLLVVFAIVLAVAMGLAALLSWFVVGRIVVRPLRSLNDTMSRVERGEIDARSTDCVGRNDEFGQLARGFDRMLDALRETQGRLRQWNETLGQRVAEKTREVERQAREVEQLEQKLESSERLAALGKLADDIAHEVGSPLTSINGHAQLLMAEPGLSTSVRESVQIMRTESQRAADIIRRRLRVTRGTASRGVSAQCDPWDAVEAARTVARLVSGEAASRGVQLEVREPEPAAAPAPVCIDRDSVLRVLKNLCANAIYAVGSRGGGGRVSIGVRRALGPNGEAAVEFRVEDDGPGIPADVRARIWDPFFTTKPPGEGSGLGLSLSRDVVRLIGGSLELEEPTAPSEASSSGANEARDAGHKGATFIVRVPTAPSGPRGSIGTVTVGVPAGGMPEGSGFGAPRTQNSAPTGPHPALVKGA